MDGSHGAVALPRLVAPHRDSDVGVGSEGSGGGLAAGEQGARALEVGEDATAVGGGGDRGGVSGGD